MKNHINVSFLLACCLSAQALAVSASPGPADNSSHLRQPAVASTWSGDTPAPSGTDNSGRQLAVLSPVPLSAHVVAHAVPAKTTSASELTKAIKLQIPTAVDEAADYCVVTSNKLKYVAAEKAQEVTKWLTAFWKQMNAPVPSATPAAPLYQVTTANTQPVVYNNGRWYMPDGRLKTLVHR